MPFELTHLAVGLAVEENPSADYLAGLIYPDIRYPIGIDRSITHSLESIKHIKHSDFYVGVKNHLDTDVCLDEIFFSHPQLIFPTEDHIQKRLYIGVYKLIHDQVCYEMILNTQRTAQLLSAFSLPGGMPVTQLQWKEWVEAVCLYLGEGPSHEGLLHIVTSMKFQTSEAFLPRLTLLDQLSETYRDVFVSLHQQLVQRVQDRAGITRG